MPGGFATRGASPESLVQTPPHPAYDFPGSPSAHMRKAIPGTDIPGDTHKGMYLITLYKPVINLPFQQR